MTKYLKKKEKNIIRSKMEDVKKYKWNFGAEKQSIWNVK